MESIAHLNAGLTREIEDLLDTASFSLETVRMALSISSQGSRRAHTLEQRLASGTPEEIEASTVALEALEHAREAYLELAHCLDHESLAAVGYDIRFWSTFDWCWNRLFSARVRASEPLQLREDVLGAVQRTARIAQVLRHRTSDTPTAVH